MCSASLNIIIIIRTLWSKINIINPKTLWAECLLDMNDINMVILSYREKERQKSPIEPPTLSLPRGKFPEWKQSLFLSLPPGKNEKIIKGGNKAFYSSRLRGPLLKMHSAICVTAILNGTSGCCLLLENSSGLHCDCIYSTINNTLHTSVGWSWQTL